MRYILSAIIRGIIPFVEFTCWNYEITAAGGLPG